MTLPQMRDAVIGRLMALAHDNRHIIFMTADMGAPALDAWRRELPGQYIDVGIAEQCMASVAAGLAREGKIVFVFAIAPFVVTRIHEFHKVNAGIQHIPYHTIGVGAGYGYGDSGPTHHNTEDIALMRVIPNMRIYRPSDSLMASSLIDLIARSGSPTYLRLERGDLPLLSQEHETFTEGFRVIAEGSSTCLVATGMMVHTALKVRELLPGADLGVVDVYALKPFPVEALCGRLSRYRRVVTIEEHLLAGGFGSILSEIWTDRSCRNELKRIGIDALLLYLYGRDTIHKAAGIDAEAIAARVLSD